MLSPVSLLIILRSPNHSPEQRSSTHLKVDKLQRGAGGQPNRGNDAEGFQDPHVDAICDVAGGRMHANLRTYFSRRVVLSK